MSAGKCLENGVEPIVEAPPVVEPPTDETVTPDADTTTETPVVEDPNATPTPAYTN